MKNLVTAIIYKAIVDWKHERRRKEIREFFCSEYGEDLCDFLGYSAKVILEKLEKAEI